MPPPFPITFCTVNNQENSDEIKQLQKQIDEGEITYAKKDPAGWPVLVAGAPGGLPNREVRWVNLDPESPKVFLTSLAPGA
jgi:hypothetical protein